MPRNVVLLLSCCLLLSCGSRPEKSIKPDLSNDTTGSPCDFPEAHQFDFWLGDWSLTWADTVTGTNHIERILNECVIRENFSTFGFEGTSVSAYDLNSKRWKQTWVDNSGAYLDFVGGLEGEEMIMSRTFLKDETPISQRMVWYNIQPDSLDWNWEVSMDQGENWKTLWHIHYRRQKP